MELSPKETTSTNWGSAIEQEVRNRVRLSVAAYSYEYLSISVMSDNSFDTLALQINPELETGNSKLDRFFQEHFSPETGMWIRKHPELHKIINLYKRYYSDEQ